MAKQAAAVAEDLSSKAAQSTGEGDWDYVDPADTEVADLTPNNNLDDSDLPADKSEKPTKAAKAEKAEKAEKPSRKTKVKEPERDEAEEEAPKPKAKKESPKAKDKKVPMPKLKLPKKEVKEEAIGDPDDEPEEADEAPVARHDEEPEESEQIDPELYSLAEEYGFTKSEVDRMGEDAIRDTLTALDRRALAEMRRQEKERSQGQKQRQDPEPKREPEQKREPEPPVRKVADGTEESFKKYKVDLDPRDFDEDTINVLNGLNDHYHNAYENITKRLDEVTNVARALIDNFSNVANRFQSEDSARFAQDMDKFFDGLGEDFRDDFGSGAMAKLKENSPAAQKRNDFVQEMNALRLVDMKRGRTPTIADLQQRALRLLYSDRLESQSRTKLAKQAEQRRNTSISRPTARPSKSGNPDQAAIDFARNYVKDNHGSFEDEIIDEL